MGVGLLAEVDHQHPRGSRGLDQRGAQAGVDDNLPQSILRIRYGSDSVDTHGQDGAIVARTLRYGIWASSPRASAGTASAAPWEKSVVDGEGVLP